MVQQPQSSEPWLCRSPGVELHTLCWIQLLKIPQQEGGIWVVMRILVLRLWSEAWELCLSESRDLFFLTTTIQAYWFKIPFLTQATINKTKLLPKETEREALPTGLAKSVKCRAVSKSSHSSHRPAASRIIQHEFLGDLCTTSKTPLLCNKQWLEHLGKPCDEKFQWGKGKLPTTQLKSAALASNS